MSWFSKRDAAPNPSGDAGHDADARLARLRSNGLLVCADGGPGSRVAVEWAAFIARATGCPVHVVSVGPTSPGDPTAHFLGRGVADDPRGKVEAVLGQLKALGVAAQGHIAQGEPGWGILTTAKSTGGQLIVLGARNEDQSLRPGLGGTAAFVLSTATTDVLVARHSPPPTAVVAGTDGSPAAERAVALALALARGLQAKAAVVQAFDKLDAQGVAGTPLAKRKDLPAGVERRIRIGEAVLTLVEELPRDSGGLLVLGNRGYSGLSLVSLGSVSDQVALRSEASVLIVKPLTKPPAA